MEMRGRNRGTRVTTAENESRSSESVALEQFLYERVEKKEEQLLKIEASAFQVANYNFVFQGVILTAIVKGPNPSSTHNCTSLRLLTLFISAIGAALNFFTLLVIAVKYKDGLDDLDDKIHDLYRHRNPGDKRSKIIDDFKKKKKKRFRGHVLVLYMIFFSMFAALNLLAALLFPCHT